MPPYNNAPGPNVPNGYPAQQPPQSPYDFFLDPSGPKKPRPGGGLGFKKIIIIAVVFFVILGIAAIVLSSKQNKQAEAPGLVTIAQNQQEIIRVNDLGQLHVESQSLKNFTATAVTTTTSEQQELITYIGKRGGKVDEKQLGLTKNARIDAVLDAAATASTYDPTFKSAMQTILADYEAKLQQAHDASLVKGDQAILKKNLNSVHLLQQMLGS